MTPYYQDDWLTVYGGDCREVMASMEPESVHCVVTSPPYWGLRDYGTATWEGGDAECDHKPNGARRGVERRASTLGGGVATITAQDLPYRVECARCGATRQDRQLGLEPTPEEYVANLVDVFREVRRVLRKDGVVWLNLGDSYASSPPGNKDYAASMAKSSGLAGAKSPQYQATLVAGHATKRNTVVGSLKPKDLVGIPWRVAFALQADGWYLRSDIIWAKPNPMPESVTEPSAWPDGPNSPESIASPFGQGFTRKAKARANGTGIYPPNRTDSGGVSTIRPRRNIRSVWQIATQPYPGAHFATFPEAIPERCIKAGCPSDGVVLDPFAGSGTTGRVANRLSRRAVLIDLNPDYLTQQMARNRAIPLGLGA